MQACFELNASQAAVEVPTQSPVATCNIGSLVYAAAVLELPDVQSSS
jgi:hypothetical protein